MNETAKRLIQTEGAKPLKVHIKVDTGMGRIGIRPDEEGLSFVKELLAMEALEVEGIFTHFARADELDKSHAEEQLTKFLDFIRRIEEETDIRFR